MLRRRRLPLPPIRNAHGLARTGFGLIPVRSPLLRESSFLSFPGVTKMCQFTPLAATPYGFRCDDQDMTPDGFPHSEISGSMPADDSPELFAVRPRLSSPLGAKASTVHPYELGHVVTLNGSIRLTVLTHVHAAVTLADSPKEESARGAIQMPLSHRSLVKEAPSAVPSTSPAGLDPSPDPPGKSIYPGPRGPATRRLPPRPFCRSRSCPPAATPPGGLIRRSILLVEVTGFEPAAFSVQARCSSS